MAKETSFTINPRGDVAATLSEVPKEFGAYLREGFRVLATIPERRFEELVIFVAEKVPGGPLRPSTRSSFSAEFGLSGEDAGPLIAAVTFTTSLILENSEITPERLGSSALSNALVDQSTSTVLVGLGQVIIRQRPALSVGLERARLGSRLLPSLVTFNSLVDVRPSFNMDTVAFAIPVALLYLETDTSEQMWMQMTKPELEVFIMDLQETFRQMTQTDNWIANRLP